MYSLAWLVVVGVLAAFLGGVLGMLGTTARSKSATRVRELEAELQEARSELTDYRANVFDQFAQTARKFKTLDETYHDLHRQLAESASLLCGEAAGPLLQAPAPAQAVTDAGEAEKEVPPAPSGEVPEAKGGSGADEAIVVAETAKESPEKPVPEREAESTPRDAGAGKVPDMEKVAAEIDDVLLQIAQAEGADESRTKQAQ